MTVSDLMRELADLPSDAVVELVVGCKDEDSSRWNFAAQVTLGTVTSPDGGFLPVGTQLAIIRGDYAQLGKVRASG